MNSRPPSISIIVPIFNVEPYLKKCIDSIVNQSFLDYEVLLINDGSTDGSEQICMNYTAQNSNIHYYTQQNQGLGPTRNRGIQLAHGKYIFFVDSDDWIAKDALKLLYQKAEEQQADIVLCDRYEVRNGTNNTQKCIPVKNPLLIETYTNVSQNPGILYQCDSTTWDKLYRRDLWLHSGLVQPSHGYEDVSNIPLLLALAQRIAQVPQCLYYYYCDRPGNITSQIMHIPDILESLKELRGNACALSIFEKNKEALELYSIGMIKGCRYHLRRCVNVEHYNQYEQKFIPPMLDFMDEAYPGWRQHTEQRYLLWGSYNLRALVSNLVLDMNQILWHYSFSSIQSIHNRDERCIRHPNAWRKSMLEGDFQGKIMRLKDQLLAVDYVIIDFMEERHPVSQLGDNYYTLSAPFYEAEWEDEEFVQICKNSILYKELENWKQYCNELIAYLKEYFEASQIIVIQSRLMTHYGEHSANRKYENQEEIEEANHWIEQCERFFLQQWPDVQTISMNIARQYLYSDASCRYGCEPCYMNQQQYLYLACQIRNKIEVDLDGGNHESDSFR